MHIWCSEVAALTGQSAHTTPLKACMTVLRRFLRGTARTDPTFSAVPKKGDGASKRRRIGCAAEKHVYQSVCLCKAPPETQRFECDRGVYRLIGHVDGVYDNQSIIEIKTRVSGVNRCFDHEYIQIQTYMECLRKKRCLFVQHMPSSNQNYVLWVHRNPFVWADSIEVRLLGVTVRMYAVLFVCVYIYIFVPASCDGPQRRMRTCERKRQKMRSHPAWSSAHLLSCEHMEHSS